MVGRERSFPDALIAEINTRDAGVTAEYVRIGHTELDDSSRYDVLVDRISHEVTYFQTFLKRAVLQGTYVVNNPFWRIADDKFFGTCLAARLGINVPKTVALPNKDYPEGIVGESLGNLKYPVDWLRILEYTGLPAYLKPHWGGGWKQVHRIGSLEELFYWYDRTGELCMMLQESIEWDQYIRCICIGKSEILAVPWDPTKSHFERYLGARDMKISQALEDLVIHEAQVLNEALGYDMNTVEFAIRDGVPYAIDFMNSAPDFDITSLGEEYFAWVVRTMADLVMDYAVHPAPSMNYRWDAFLAGNSPSHKAGGGR